MLVAAPVFSTGILPMAGMYKFEKEYEFRASAKLLFQYISTPSGLADWFCDDVQFDNLSHKFNFIWDDSDHWAKLSVQKPNKHTKFEFEHNGAIGDEPAYLDFRLEANDMTQSVFLKVTDYSANTDHEELEELWDGLVHSLREVVGG